jgi:diaminopimelate decarboxylase
MRAQLSADDVALLEAIAAQVGTPTYVYSADQIRARFQDFARALAPLDPLIAYAAKANSNIEIMRLLAGLGAGADIVSGGELRRAEVAGISPQRIVYSGVGKTTQELAAALDAELFQITLESLEEARELSSLAVAAGKAASAGLRVTPGIELSGGHQKISTGCTSTKFGIPLDEALSAWQEIHALPGIRLQGPAIHLGSQMLSLEPLRNGLELLDGFISLLKSEGFAMDTISVGGGLGVAYQTSDRAPPLHAYAELILSYASRWNARLILEPGRWLVAGAGRLLTRVIRVKQSAKKQFAILDAGMNDLMRPSLYDAWHEIAPVAIETGQSCVNYDLVGPICETSDIFGRDRPLPVLQSGDLVTIADTGAYASSMAGNYNSRGLAAEVLVENGRWRIVRRRQTLDDLLALESSL